MAENKWIFDQLERKKEELERGFGDKLHWHRLDGTKASRICFSHPFDAFNDEIWPEMIDWLCEHIVQFDNAFSDMLAHLNQQLKSGGDTLVAEQHDPGSVATDLC